MEEQLHYYTFPSYQTCSGKVVQDLQISYQIFGKSLHTAPIVLVHHALTGNSDVVSEEKGWWRELVGEGKLIDTQRYTIIAFNIPGNGYQGDYITSYQDFSLYDVAFLFYQSLKCIGVEKVYAAIGGSIGGSVAWQLATLTTDFIEYIIPIASDWKATAWVLGYCAAQEQILQHSSHPLNDARIVAMLLYRTPKSLQSKFGRTKTNDGKFNVNSWLQYHGKKLEERFDLRAYRMMNHLLTTINIAGESSFRDVARSISSTVIQLAIDTDFFFVKEENVETAQILDELGIQNQYYEVKSLHGHDGFLIEHEQITHILKPIFE